MNQDGQAVTELTYAAGQPTWSHSNAYAGGELLATYDLQGTHFHLTDWLGNRRVQANAFGQAELVCANLPFGNGLRCSAPGNGQAANDVTKEHYQRAAVG